MIRVGIIGAETKNAGELLRLLMFHPEVEISTLYSPTLTGHKLSTCHHGFIGESDYYFSDKIDLSHLNAVFLMDDSALSHLVLERASEWNELRIIDLSPSRFGKNMMEENLAYGLSEINRKTLVRGATMARVPSLLGSLSLIALYPLASHLLLSSDIDIESWLPHDIIEETDTKFIEEEIKQQLMLTQMSFSGAVNLSLHPVSSERSVMIRIDLKCPLGLDEILKIYEGVYDDHNFTFISDRSVQSAEVVGTQKCILTFNKPGAGLLEIVGIADARMRGGAGDAVHILNLLFALHEKVGLTFKPSIYSSELSHNDDGKEDFQRHSDWFA